MKKQLLIPIALVALSVLSVFYLFNSKLTLNAEYKTHLEAARNAAKNNTMTLAMDEYEKALAISPSVGVYVEIGENYLNQGDTLAATRWYERNLLSAYPTSPETYEFGIKTALAKERYADAFVIYDEAVKRKVHSDTINEMIKSIKFTFSLNGMFTEARPFTASGYAAVKQYEDQWEYVGKEGFPEMDKGYDTAGFFLNGKAAVTRDNEAFFINDKEEKILTGGYFMDENSDLRSVRQFGDIQSGIVEIYDGSTWGYYNAETYKKIAGGFKEVTPITMGVGAVTKNGTDWALIGPDGELITDYVFDDYVLDEKGVLCRNNVFFMGSHMKYILVDTTGKQVGSQQYEEVRGFNDDSMAAVKKNGKWIYVDTEGKEYDLGKFEDARSFANGLAPVCIGTKWGYIDKEGNVLIECQFADAQMLNDKGLGFVKDDNNKWRILALYSRNH